MIRPSKDCKKGNAVGLGWKKPKHERGTRVKVFKTDRSYLGEGSLLTEYDSQSENNPMPEIALDNGETILGCDCWWIPISETRIQE